MPNTDCRARPGWRECSPRRRQSHRYRDRPRRTAPAPSPHQGAARPSCPRMRRRVPGPLVALLLASTLLGIAWALLTPAFQAPDENAHFAYVQALGEDLRLPGDPARRTFSQQQFAANDAVNADQTAGQTLVKPEWS